MGIEGYSLNIEKPELKSISEDLSYLSSNEKKEFKEKVDFLKSLESITSSANLVLLGISIDGGIEKFGKKIFMKILL